MSITPFERYRRERSDVVVSGEAAAYLRESDPSELGAKRRGENRGTIDEQRRDAEFLASRLGLRLGEVYEETEQGDVWGRPQLQRMLRDINAHRFQHLIIWHPDRLSRDPDIRGNVRRALRSARITLHYVKAPEAAHDTVEGRVADAAYGIASTVEKQRIRERTQTMRQVRAKSGSKIIAGGFPKYGYNWVLDARHRIVNYEIDPETAPVAREVIQRVARGDLLRRIVADLNDRQIPTRGETLKRRGLLSPKAAARVKNHWTRNMLAEIVYSPEYSGVHLNYHTVSEYEEETHPLTGIASVKRKLLLRPSERAYLPLDEILSEYGEYAVPMPGVVDRETHLAAQARMRSQSRPARGDHQDALLSGGYVLCGYCRHPMAVQRVKKQPSRNRYFCTHTIHQAWTTAPDCTARSNSVHIKLLDHEVWGDIVGGLQSPDVLVALLTRAQEAIGEHEDHTRNMLDLLRAELDAVNNDMDGLIEQSMQKLPMAAREAISAKMTDVGNRIEKLKARIAEAHATAANQEAYQARVQEVRDWAVTVSEGLESLDYEGKRWVLFILGVEVQVWRANDEEARIQNDARRWRLRTDFEGLNLGARLGTDGWERYSSGRANNNARNYAVVNALDLEALLGLPVGNGNPIPPPIEATIHERAEGKLGGPTPPDIEPAPGSAKPKR